MSTSATPAPSVPASRSEITIFSHSGLFYWWPVWVLGFIFALITWVENTRVIHIPARTKVEIIEGGGIKLGPGQEASASHTERLRLMVKKYTDLATEDERRSPPRVSDDAGLGTVFLIILLIVIGITNVPLRGLWSIIIIVIIVLVSVILGIAHIWDWIFDRVSSLHIYIGLAGYLFFSTVLLIMWLVTMFIYDHQIYITFAAGQMRVCEEIGGGEKAYDTAGMAIEKHRDDLFRHWVLGLGSGDLTVRTAGAQIHTITMPNVLFISRKLKQIEDMQREKQIVG